MGNAAKVTTPIPTDAAVAAAGPWPVTPSIELDALLAQLSHHDPDHHAPVHAYLWSRVLEAAAACKPTR